jgi:TRAP-type mannitol/chloroaromatic compound transport system permease large subunit
VKVRKEQLFGFTIMALIVLPVIIFTPWTTITNGHIGLIMLALVVVAIMLGFPTAFTLMGMGVMFAYYAYRSVAPDSAVQQVLDLMVQRTYGVMANDVLIAVPLFVFMGYLVERAALIDRLFKSLHLALSRVPGSLAVATIVTCAIFATATGIVGAVVTLMGLLALPPMLKAGYDTRLAAGSITAGGCLGILIPPSVLLIVYGATAGVSVVQLYAGAFFPGIMLAGLYVGYVVILVKLKPAMAPPLPEAERRVPLSPVSAALKPRGPRNAVVGLARSFAGPAPAGLPRRRVAGQLVVSLLPMLAVVALLGWIWSAATQPVVVYDTAGLSLGSAEAPADTGLAEPPSAGGLAEPANTGLAEPPAESSGVSEPPKEEAGGLTEPPAAAAPVAEAPKKAAAPKAAPAKPAPAAAERLETPRWFWITTAILGSIVLTILFLMNWERLEIFKMLLTSFFPLAVLILAVLGSIVFGLATPAEAAAVGAFGGFWLAVAYRYIYHRRVVGSNVAAINPAVRELGTILKDSSFLCAKTTAMVCWLFVGSAIFSAAFALLGGQEIIERWVLSLGLTPIQFMLLAQFIIFVLGWPLEWTEIIVIFMPIFIPLLPKFGIDPLFFGLMVALNLQTAFLSPPVAMAAFYLKGVAPPHVRLAEIFMGMLPFMGIQVVAMAILYMWPQIGLWLPKVVYG